MTFSEFLYMDGYAFYVWSAYALAAIVLTVNFLIPIGRRRRLLRELARRRERERGGR